MVSKFVYNILNAQNFNNTNLIFSFSHAKFYYHVNGNQKNLQGIIN